MTPISSDEFLMMQRRCDKARRAPTEAKETPPTPQGNRLRQDSKPLLNKLEREWFAVLSAGTWDGKQVKNLRAQAKRYRLGNGIWFKPDMTANLEGPGGLTQETAWEVKGPHSFRGGFENLKVAAGLWPEVLWLLVWKKNGQWQQQEVLP